MSDLEQAREILDRLPYPGVTEYSPENSYRFKANLEAIDKLIHPERYADERERMRYAFNQLET